MTGAAINNWLLSVGLLEIIRLSNGKQRKGPTDRGNELGISPDERNGQLAMVGYSDFKLFETEQKNGTLVMRYIKEREK